ncbi:mRNA export factor GLE1 [Leptodactylus fuscus]|uniref:mRNA export factor GLE1 n=1 Tax=Leptodactylus fuscus TaxID=238119 RepID=UPI003F4E964C
MPSKRDWETLEALKNSPKGRLQYNRDWSSENPLDINEPTVVLSEYSAWVLDNVVNRMEPDSSSVERLPSPEDSTSITPTEPDNCCSEESVKEVESSSKLRMDKAMEVEGSILLFEKAQKMKVKEELQARLDMCDQFSKSIAEKSAEQLKRFEEMMELKHRQEKHQLLEELEKGSKEALGQQEKLKEEHRHRAKLLTLKLREAEQQRQQEMERVRQEEGRERMRRLCFLQQEVLRLVQKIQVDYKQQEALRVDLSAYGHRGNQICGILSSVIRSSSERGYLTQDDVNLGERSLQEMQKLASTIEKELAEAEQRKKAEEAAAKEKQKEAQLQQQQEQQQQAKPQTLAPAQVQKQSRQEGLQKKASKGTLQQFLELQKVLELCQKACEDLATCKDPQTKKIRADLQRAVTTPVSQISSVSGSQVKDTFEKINNFLMGKPAVSAGKTILLSQHPLSLDFVCLKLAEKLVSQGEEEVASHHESAFPIASVASALWERYPKVGELFLANLHKKCPYAVPFYPSFKEGTPVEEYQRLLGYQVKDSIVEQQDSFLKRMSGMIRLYAAIMQVRWPYGTNKGSHPHGLNHGWHWLAQMVNMEPLSDITATLLFDFLEVCGNAMIKQYQDQFWKLLFLIKDQYFPMIEKITTSTEMGSASRLKHFLEGAVRRRDIPLPKGYLQPSFWRTSGY